MQMKSNEHLILPLITEQPQFELNFHRHKKVYLNYKLMDGFGVRNKGE